MRSDRCAFVYFYSLSSAHFVYSFFHLWPLVYVITTSKSKTEPLVTIMTSTEFTVGLDGTRVSSKVLKPPGGGSSDIFGFGSVNHSSNGVAPHENKPQDNSTKSRLFGETNQTPARVQKDSKNNIFGSEPPVERKTAKKPYVKRNPITGEEIIIYPEDERKENDEIKCEENNKETNGVEVDKTEAPPAKPVQTSIRVRAPPGGKSSGIF